MLGLLILFVKKQKAEMHKTGSPMTPPQAKLLSIYSLGTAKVHM